MHGRSGGGPGQVPLQHHGQSLVPGPVTLGGRQCGPLPGRPGLPAGHARADHAEQAVGLRRGHAGVQQPAPGRRKQLRHQVSGGRRADPAAVRPAQLGGQAVLGGTVETVVGPLERQRVGPALVLAGAATA